MDADPLASIFLRPVLLALFASSVAVTAPPAAAEGCQTELRVFADDLQDIELTERQRQDIAGLVMQARRYCWVHQESVAMRLINKARSTAGLKPSTGEFDWENVPLDSLEKTN